MRDDKHNLDHGIVARDIPESLKDDIDLPTVSMVLSDRPDRPVLVPSRYSD